MRILMYSQWYPPEPDIKIHLLATGLAEAGHEVTVVTGFPNYPFGSVYDGYKIRWRQVENRDGVSIIRVPLFPDHSAVGWRRVLNYLSWAMSAAVLGPTFCGRTDVIWAYHPPPTVAAPAYVTRLLRRAPVVYEVQDLWPETLRATGMVTNPGVLRWMEGAVNMILRSADAVVAISEGFVRNIVARGVAADRVVHIPNWADEALYYAVEESPPSSGLPEFEGSFNILYAGNLGAAQDLDNLLDAAHLLRGGPALIHVMGEGIDGPRLRRRAAEEGLDNVRFHSRRPAEEMSAIFERADCLLVHLGPDEALSITMPSKLTAYLAAGQPVIGVCLGEPAAVLERAGAGISCPPRKPEALAEAIRRMAEMSPEMRQALGRSGRAYFHGRLRRSVLMNKYLELFARVA